MDSLRSHAVARVGRHRRAERGRVWVVGTHKRTDRTDRDTEDRRTRSITQSRNRSIDRSTSRQIASPIGQAGKPPRPSGQAGKCMQTTQDSGDYRLLAGSLGTTVRGPQQFPHNSSYADLQL